MMSSTKLCMAFVVILLLLFSQLAIAKKVTLKCSRGYQVNITFTLHYPLQEPPDDRRSFTMTCPPDSVIDVPDGYQQIQVQPGDGTMTAPDGSQTDLALPSPVDNSPAGSAGGWAPWPPLPLGEYHSYIGSRQHWEIDPFAPPFIQAGEVLLGEYVAGSRFPFTVTILNQKTQQPIEGASIALKSSSTGINSSTLLSNSSGEATFDADAGGVYFIRVEAAGYFPQVSDEFQLLGEHKWTMLLLSGNVLPVNSPAILDYLSLILMLIVIILVVIVFMVRRRQSHP